MFFEDAVRINGSVLKWARERLNPAEAAAALTSFSGDQVANWESGVAEPTFNQAAIIAKKLGIPFGYLLLSEVPTRNLSLPDLRTVPGQAVRIPSIGMMMVIDDAVRKQHWYADFLRERDDVPKAYVGSFSPDADARRVAADIRDVIGIDEQMRTESAPSVTSFLTELVRRSERAGIIVLRSGTACGNPHRLLDVNEFRGFALPDPLAPMIFINSRDALVAQLFTWAHEIAHIWLNVSGISEIDFTRKTMEQDNGIEIKCNEIAADVLVPSAGFLHNWNRSVSPFINIELLRARYRVSNLVILRKANDMGLLTGDQFHEGLQRYYYLPLDQRLKKAEGKSSGNYYNSLYARNSNTLTATVAEGYAAGSVATTEACRLLRISQGTLKRIVAAT